MLGDQIVAMLAQACGPMKSDELAACLDISTDRLMASMFELIGEGTVVRYGGGWYQLTDIPFNRDNPIHHNNKRTKNDGMHRNEVVMEQLARKDEQIKTPQFIEPKTLDAQAADLEKFRKISKRFIDRVTTAKEEAKDGGK